MNLFTIYISALLVSYLLYRLINKRLFDKISNPTKRALYTFAISLILILLLISMILGPATAIVIYAPCLVFWLIFDMIKIRRHNSNDQ